MALKTRLERLKMHNQRPKTCCPLVHTDFMFWPLAGTPTHPIYAIPRGNLVAVGGTYLEDDHEINIRPEEEDKLRANAKLILPDEGEGFEEVGGWVGFRPLRKGGVNLGVNEEMSDKSGLKWIDNFGHGGSGWTVCTGCADDVVELAA